MSALNHRKTKIQSKRNSQSGQGIVEYVLVIGLVISAVALMTNLMPSFLARLETPIQDSFRYAYKYGDSRARGPEDPEGPKYHPRIYSDDNFRIFSRASN